MYLTYVGTDKELSELTEKELLELYHNDNINSVSKTQINMELAKRLDKLPKS